MLTPRVEEGQPGGDLLAVTTQLMATDRPGVHSPSVSPHPTAPPATARRLKGVVLAGTYLWSGSQFETLLPRPLLPVAQAPLISYVLRWIHAAGISSTTICANGSSRAIHEALDEGHFLPMRLDHHTDTMPRGPAGCLRDAGVPTDADTFVVAEGATIPAANLERVLCEHWRARAALTVVAHIETVTDAASKTHLSPAGVYVCDRRVLDFIAEAGFQDIKEHLIPQLYRAGERVDVHVCEPASQRVLDASSYVAVNQRAVENIVRQLVDAPRPYIRSGDLVAHPTADVHPNAVLVGPVLLGRSVRISDTATSCCDNHRCFCCGESLYPSVASIDISPSRSNRC